MRKISLNVYLFAQLFSRTQQEKSFLLLKLVFLINFIWENFNETQNENILDNLKLNNISLKVEFLDIYSIEFIHVSCIQQ